ncbi:MAG: GrdX family protein [Oscillospiraceae bacterium]|nr:GrdX family protein [Oscillospiraceae bacterium]
MDILVTNNPLVKAQLEDSISVEYIETDLLAVLTYVRDLVHKGHRLLTHPLSGSIKPNETIYKSVIITGNPGNLDVQSVSIIGESILTVQKFPKRQFTDEYLSDMQTVDLSLIKSALPSHNN